MNVVVRGQGVVRGHGVVRGQGDRAVEAEGI